ncbi:hypothetical protein BC831DRAFT_496216, partial [Entophlyctis helioformis]
MLLLLLPLRGTSMPSPRRREAPLLLVRRDTLCHCTHQATASQQQSVGTILPIQVRSNTYPIQTQ